MKRIIISILLLLVVGILPAVQLEKIDTVILKGGGGDDFIKAPAPFAVSEDELYFIPDHKDSDIKVFDVKGNFVKRIGRKGNGPMEFISPRESDYYDRHFIVLDLGKREYMFFSREKNAILKEIDLLRSPYMGNDVAIMKNDTILFSGYKTDQKGNDWACFTYDFKSKKYEHLMTEYTLFGFDSKKEYKLSRNDLRAIGFSGFCDWWGEYAYLLWKGNLKIYKINIRTKQFTTFGKKTTNYNQPIATDTLKKALAERNTLAWGKEMGRYSLIIGLYTNKDYLLVMYNKPKKEVEEINSRMLQFYALDGKYINELQITKNAGCGLYLSKDKNDNILYMLQWIQSTDENDEYYQMTRYKMKK